MDSLPVMMENDRLEKWAIYLSRGKKVETRKGAVVSPTAKPLYLERLATTDTERNT